MPLRWKIYYWCSTYMVAWGVFMLLFLCYGILVRRISTGDDYAIFAVMFILVLLMLTKSILSIRTTNHYKNATVLSKIERLFFVILFITTTGFILLVIAFCVIYVIPQYFLQSDAKTLSLAPRLNVLTAFYISIFILMFTGCFVSICDLFLLKAIRKKHYGSLISMGDSIGDHL